MFRHSTNTARFFSVLIVVLIFSLSLAGVAAAQDNTSLGTGALVSNTTGALQHRHRVDMLSLTTLRAAFNTGSGAFALFNNTTGDFNTASGVQALFSNTTGDRQHRQRTQCTL